MNTGATQQNLECIMIDKKYKSLAEQTVNLVEGIKRTGLQIIGMKDGYVKLMMPLAGNVNHVGIMYAGSLFTIGEVTGGIYWGLEFDVEKFYPIVKEINIQFRKPAATDVTLERAFDSAETKRIEAEAEQNGKADFTLDLEITDAGDQVVSLVRGIWQIRKTPEELKGLFKSAIR
jgi:acyl-coenzyme A thioesterase PaaI-like protein